MASLLEYAIMAAWFSAAIWVCMMLLAFILHRVRRAPSVDSGKKLIVQITTIGDEAANTTLAVLRKMRLPQCELWVVNEPFDSHAYPGADRVITVPASFETSERTKFKGRALEYARLYRRSLGLRDYKVLFLDDDSIPSEQFVRECYSDSDMLQGPVTVRQDGLLSYLDGAMRTYSCLSICSFFQEFSRPIWTHGEGFCIDEAVDRTVSWDEPGWCSEDLVYGAKATREYGFRMHSTYATVSTTSPLNFREFVKQRRRWAWTQLRSLYLLPRSSKAEILWFWLFGLAITPLALFGTGLSLVGLFSLPYPLHQIFVWLFPFWLGAWGISGFYDQRTVTGAAGSVLAAMVAPAFNFVLSVVGFAFGPVERFEVLKRERLAYGISHP